MFHHIVRKTIFRAFIALSLVSPLSLASDSTTTPEELELVNQEFRLKVYRPNEATKGSLTQYKHIIVEPVSVAFRKNWRRRYNHDQSSLATYVNKSEEEKLAAKVKVLFDEEFAKQLGKLSTLSTVDKAQAGTLKLVPKIEKLSITQPDLKKNTTTRTLVYSAGHATLVLDVYDASTNTHLGRIEDTRYATEHHEAQRASSVFNRSEAKRVVRRWARDLDENLGFLF